AAEEQQRLHLSALAPALAVRALRQQERYQQDEQAALLARQAYLFNEKSRGNVLDQVDEALRTVLRTSYFSHSLWGHENWVQSVAFSVDGQLLASGSADSTIRLWNLRQPDPVPQILRGHENWVQSVAFSADGQLLASGSADSTIRLWNLRQPDPVPQILRGHKRGVQSVAFSADGQNLQLGRSGSARRP